MSLTHSAKRPDVSLPLLEEDTASFPPRMSSGLGPERNSVSGFRGVWGAQGIAFQVLIQAKGYLRGVFGAFFNMFNVLGGI